MKYVVITLLLLTVLAIIWILKDGFQVRHSGPIGARIYAAYLL